jgi:hypothetical protein
MGGTCAPEQRFRSAQPAPLFVFKQPHMSEATELRRLKAEYVVAAKRAMDAIRKHGVNSELFLQANAELAALMQDMKALAAAIERRAGNVMSARSSGVGKPL